MLRKLLAHFWFWTAVAILYSACAVALSVVGAPTPFLFAGVLAGGACALRLPNPQPFPQPIRQLGLGIIGTAAGSMIDLDVVRTLGTQPLAVVLGVFATLAVSLAAGQLLNLSSVVNGQTAIFASIAGGASGVSAIAREFDADEAIVLAVQYLRVLFVLATIPLLAPLIGDTGHSAPRPEYGSSSLGYVAIALGTGLLLATILRFSGSRLVLPLLAATSLSLSGAFPEAGVPAALLNFGYATTGLMVGLSFTPETLRQLRKIMPLAAAQLLIGVGSCAAVGVVFARVAGVDALTGYLATTPGGLPAVTAIAIGSSANVGLVICMQLLRVFIALLLAPIIGAFLRRRHLRN